MTPFEERYSDEDLLWWFRKLAKALGRRPVRSDIEASSGPSFMTYYRRFGSLKEVAKLAGLK